MVCNHSFKKLLVTTTGSGFSQEPYTAWFYCKRCLHVKKVSVKGT